MDTLLAITAAAWAFLTFDLSWSGFASYVLVFFALYATLILISLLDVTLRALWEVWLKYRADRRGR